MECWRFFYVLVEEEHLASEDTINIFKVRKKSEKLRDLSAELIDPNFQTCLKRQGSGKITIWSESLRNPSTFRN